jgi:hypothetical protein
MYQEEMVRRARFIPTQRNPESLGRLSSHSCFSAVFSKTDYLSESKYEKTTAGTREARCAFYHRNC